MITHNGSSSDANYSIVDCRHKLLHVKEDWKILSSSVAREELDVINYIRKLIQLAAETNCFPVYWAKNTRLFRLSFTMKK